MTVIVTVAVGVAATTVAVSLILAGIGTPFFFNKKNCLFKQGQWSSYWLVNVVFNPGVSMLLMLTI